MIRYFLAAFFLWLSLVTAQMAVPQSIPFPGPGGGAGTLATAIWDSATVTNSGVLTNGSLTFQFAGASGNVARSSLGTATTKVFYLITLDTCTTCGAGFTGFGAIDDSQATVTPTSTGAITAKIWEWRTDALRFNNAASVALGSAAAQGGVYAVAIDNSLGSGSGKIWWGTCSGGTVTWMAGDPAAGTGASYSNLTGTIKAFVNYWGSTEASKTTVNFGGTTFSCTAPVGFGVF